MLKSDMKTLAIDFGEKRIGLAISDELGISSAPLGTIKVKSDTESVREIIRTYKEHKADQILFGIPLNPDGSIGKIGNQVKRFAAKLKSGLDTKILFRDEYLSSKTAEDKKNGGKNKKRNGSIDSEAARIILQEFLNSNGN